MTEAAEGIMEGPVEPRPKFTAGAVVRSVIGVVVLAWVLSWVYGPAEHYSPLVYLNAALAYFFGWLVGAIGRGFLRRNRINSRGAALLIGGVGGLAAVIFSWMTYVCVITEYDLEWYWTLLKNPLVIWNWMEFLSENPVWVISRSKSGGGFPLMYYVAWLLELGVIAGVAVSVCKSFLNDNILCGQCNDWVAKTEDTALFSLPDDAGPALARLGAREVGVLTELSRIGPDDEIQSPFWLLVQGYACPNCRDLEAYVTVTLITAKKGKGDQIEYEKKDLATFMPIDRELEKALFDAPPPAAVPAASGAEEPEAEAGESAEAGDGDAPDEREG